MIHRLVRQLVDAFTDAYDERDSLLPTSEAIMRVVELLQQHGQDHGFALAFTHAGDVELVMSVPEHMAFKITREGTTVKQLLGPIREVAFHVKP